MIIALNIVLAAIVIIGIVGMLAWSIATQDGQSTAEILRPARRRRRATTRARFIGRAIDNRA
jgi:hypothetical protein